MLCNYEEVILLFKKSCILSTYIKLKEISVLTLFPIVTMAHGLHYIGEHKKCAFSVNLNFLFVVFRLKPDRIDNIYRVDGKKERQNKHRSFYG